MILLYLSHDILYSDVRDAGEIPADDRISAKKYPRCGWVNRLENLEIMEVTSNPREAGEIVRRLQGEGQSFMRADELR